MGRKILAIDVLDAEKRRVPSKHYVYIILVKWSDGTELSVFRRYSRFFDLQTRLLDLFPIEGGTVDPSKRMIPFLPGKIFFGRSHIKDVAMKRLKEIDAYCKTLINLPPHISQCDEVLEFFEVEPEDLDPPSKDGDEGLDMLYTDIDAEPTPGCKLKSSKEKKAEKISKPKRLDCYVAVAHYAVQAPGEMALQSGLKVEVLEKSDSGWWFVNSEDEQGWVPSTYLEPEGGANPNAMQGTRAEPGKEENFICIEKFDAASSDEVSLEKGSVVQVLQKNMDGWWLVRYNGREAYAPGTYLKKASNAQTVNLVEKSRLSGVEIISSLQDVSNLLNQEQKGDAEQVNPYAAPVKNTSAKPAKKPTPARPSAVLKQRSLERGGSLVPPPRQNSIKKMHIPSSLSKSNIYVTAEDFCDTVGDGLSFGKGQKVFVKEKTPTGWWFVKMGENEGWVPASYLEPYDGPEEAHDYQVASSLMVSSCEKDDFADDDDDDDDWYMEPDVDKPEPEVTQVSSTHAQKAKRPLPPVPPDEDQPSSSPPKTSSRPLPAAPKEPAQKPLPPKLPGAPKPKETVSPKSSVTPDPPPKPANGPQDLAALLKAKFESRSGAAGDSGNLSDEDAGKSKSAAKRLPSQPLLPKKPPGTKTESEEASPHLPSSKPPLPTKAKPDKPFLPSKPAGGKEGQQQTSRPSLPPPPAKPASKPELNNNKGAVDTPPKASVKSMTAALSTSLNLKPVPGEKPDSDRPQLPSKPKPSVSAKPSPPTKPGVSEPKPSGQSVNSLVNSLGGKLNFGQRPPLGKGSSTEGASDQLSSAPALPVKPVTGSPAAAPKSSSYVAIYDFVAQNEGEVSFNEGDEVEVLEDQGDWFLIRCWDEEGWAPSSYLQKL